MGTSDLNRTRRFRHIGIVDIMIAKMPPARLRYRDERVPILISAVGGDKAIAGELGPEAAWSSHSGRFAQRSHGGTVI